jgi:hypothetical protein
MAMMDQDFWRRASKAAPGLFDLGIGAYGMSAGQKEAEQRLQGARGPAYDQAMNASAEALTRAGNMDPNAAAAERYKAQTGLMAGKDAADETQLMRMLQSRGLLGAANYNPGVEGIAPSGTPMNPQLAAFYAARGGRDAKIAADSLDAGDQRVNMMLQRSGMLANQAANQQRSGLAAASTQPSRVAGTVNLLKGASGILKDLGGVSGAKGLLGQGFDWLRNLNSPAVPAAGWSLDGQGTDFGDWYGW